MSATPLILRARTNLGTRQLLLEYPELEAAELDEWPYRLTVMRQLYASGGRAVEALASTEGHHSKAYRHRQRSPLFKDCWKWVVRCAKQSEGRDWRPEWEQMWPRMAPSNLKARLVAAGVLSPEDAEL